MYIHNFDCSQWVIRNELYMALDLSIIPNSFNLCLCVRCRVTNLLLKKKKNKLIACYTFIYTVYLLSLQ